MARPKSGANLTIAQLERALRSRRGEKVDLARTRRKLLKELSKIDKALSHLTGGGASAGTGTRPRNEKTLVETLEEVMKSGGKMGVSDITAGVVKSGYKSSAANFRGIVNQTLIKEKKRFSPTGERGMYQLKK